MSKKLSIVKRICEESSVILFWLVAVAWGTFGTYIIIITRQEIFMSRKELTWSALSTLILIAGIVVCLVGIVGCTEIKISESPRSLEEEVNETQNWELHDLSIPVTDYDINKIAQPAAWLNSAASFRWLVVPQRVRPVFYYPTARGLRAGAAHPPKEGEKYLVLFPNNVKFSVAIGRYIQYT